MRRGCLEAFAEQLFDMSGGRDAIAVPGTRRAGLGVFRASGRSARGGSELLRNHKRDHLLVFLTLAGTVALAWVITVSYVRERRHHRATRDLAEQLQSANTLLSAEAATTR